MNIRASENIAKQDIARSFGRAAAQYDQHAIFQRWACGRLFRWCPKNPVSTILDLGAGTGYALPRLATIASDHLIAMDLSLGMMQFASQQDCVQSNCYYIVGDAELAGIQSASVDLIFSSLMIQWTDTPERILKECYRVLKPGGRLVFSSLVDGSLFEMKEAWSLADDFQHINQFLALARYEQACQTLAWSDMCLEVEQYTSHYIDVKSAMRALKGLGAHNMTRGRSKSLTGVKTMKRFISAYESFREESGKLPLSYQTLLACLDK